VRCISNMRRILIYKYIQSMYILGRMSKWEFVNISFRGCSLMKGSWLFCLGDFTYAEGLSSFCGVTWIVSVLCRTLLINTPTQGHTHTHHTHHTHIHTHTPHTHTHKPHTTHTHTHTHVTHIQTHTHTHKLIYIYILKERESEREIESESNSE